MQYMRYRTKIAYVSLFLLALLSFLLIGLYAYMFEHYQGAYIETIKTRIPDTIARNPYDKRFLVFVCIDGMRYSEAFGAEGRYIPHIWNDLRPLGTIYTNCRTESVSLTTTVHSVWLSGNDQYLSNRGYIHPTMPTFIELYRDARNTWAEREFAKLPQPSRYFPLSKETQAALKELHDEATVLPKTKTYCIVGKDRILDAVNYSSHPAFGEAYDSEFYRSMLDNDVYAIFNAKLGHDKPRMFFMNLADVDEEGHTADWEWYTEAIAHADEIVWKMWNDIQANPAFRDKTYFIVTSDHGRHDDAHGGFAHHGDRCNGCLHVPFLIIGPGVKAGQVTDKHATEYDLQPTIGRIFGFETPFAVGRVLDEAFIDPAKFPPPIETPKTKALKEEMKKWRSDSVGEWYSWALGNIKPETLAGVDDFALQTYLLGLVNFIHIRDKDFQPAVQLIKANAERPGVVLPAVWLWRYTNDEAIREIARKGASKLPQSIQFRGSLMSLKNLAILAPALCQAGAAFNNIDWTNAGAQLLKDKMVALEGEVTLEGDLNQFVSRFDYLTDINEMYTREMTPDDKALFLTAFGLSLDGTGDAFDKDDLYFLKRNFRLQYAFAGPDCNSYCLYAGENGHSYPARVIAANFLYDAIIANDPPWQRAEFVELGYGPAINHTALNSFPAQHYFYIMNLGNAYLDSGTNFHKLRISINWDDVFNDKGVDNSDAATALGAGLLAGARWGRITHEDYSFNLFPPEWVK